MSVLKDSSPDNHLFTIYLICSFGGGSSSGGSCGRGRLCIEKTFSSVVTTEILSRSSVEVAALADWLPPRLRRGPEFFRPVRRLRFW